MKTILYISSNDGSDMRITKEVKSLSQYFKVIFIGIIGNADCYVKNYCSEIFLIKGRRNTIVAIVKQFIRVVYLVIFRKIESIHVINEQLMVFFYPVFIFKHTVLDLFDSIFFKMDYPGNKMLLLKRLIYAPVNKIIVTDENRYNLMADFLKKKCVVVPNFPNKIENIPSKKTGEILTILYNGWMGLGRGTEIVEGLLKTGFPIRFLMAGWFSDEYTKSLVKRYSSQIDFKGVMAQKDVLLMTAEYADYILCVYAPLNTNNINASPNKVFDSIMVDTPIIINEEVKISQWVKDHNVGLVIENYDVSDFEQLYHQLIKYRGKFNYSNELKKEYIWESVENNLLLAHNLMS